MSGHGLSGQPGDKTVAPGLPQNYWRLDDQRTGDTIIIKAYTSQDAIRQFLECCAENVLTMEANAADLENFGPAWGEEVKV